MPVLCVALHDLVLELSAFFLELMLPCLQLLQQWSSQLWWG
jgi:hypothetical protein